MKKSEAKKMLFNVLKPFFIKNGYKLVASGFSGFINQLENGIDWIYFDSVDHNPCQNIYFTVIKRIDEIEKIWQEVDRKYFNSEQTKTEFSQTLTFSYESQNEIFSKVGYLPIVYGEGDIKVNADLIIEFMSNVAFPLLSKFNDIREIDLVINNNNFWESDLKKPFGFGGSKFAFMRTILAHLCSNKRIMEIEDYHLKYWNDNLKEYPNCQNSISAYLFLLELLKSKGTLDTSV